MMTIREYKRAESLEEAWQLNQKKNNRVIDCCVMLPGNIFKSLGRFV